MKVVNKIRFNPGQREIDVLLVYNPKARRYILRLRRDGVARLTIPRAGSAEFALEFLQRQRAWLGKQLAQFDRARPATALSVGNFILIKGELCLIEPGPDLNSIRIGAHILSIPHAEVDLSPVIHRFFWDLAVQELPGRLRDLALQTQTNVYRIQIRNQRTRWGSCSRKGTISLNYRLIQVPDKVRDYLMLHELMHRREMNHSVKYWREVESVCPDYRSAESWLKKHHHLLWE